MEIKSSYRNSYLDAEAISDSLKDITALSNSTDKNLDTCSEREDQEYFKTSSIQLSHKKKQKDTKELLELRALKEPDITCGLRSCSPLWIQALACKEVYLILYCMMGLIVGMFFSYSVAVMTTFEKRFKITSKQSGVILAGNDVSQVILSVFASYYINFGHRPRWLGVGMMSASLACFLAASPHFIYGPGEDAIEIVSNSNRQASNSTKSDNLELCYSNNSTICNEKDGSSSKEYLGPVILLFLCQFFIGIMTCIYSSIGFVYLDDNSDKKNSSVYIAVASILKLMGPLSGFMLGSKSLSLWIDPSEHPNLSQKDPRWVGAWWIGYLLMSVLLLFIGVFFFFFPRKLPQTLLKEVRILRKKDAEDGNKVESLQHYVDKIKIEQSKVKATFKNLPIALKRLFTNKIWLGNAFSSTIAVLAISGISSFMPKYYEAQFRKSASEANVYLGVSGMASTLLGLLVSSLFMRFVRPGPRVITGYLAFLIVFAGITVSALTHSTFRCPKIEIMGLNQEMNSTSSCWNECGCSLKYEPVCGQDNITTYYSGCYAGCTHVNNSFTPPRYENCKCLINSNRSIDMENISSNSHENTTNGTLGYVTRGYCPENCSGFFNYMIFISTLHFVMSTGRVAGTIVNLRAVAEEDKALSIGTLFVLMSLLGFIPGPIIMGAMLDSTCLIWDDTCGTKGNCWFYDSDKMTTVMHVFPAVLIFVASIGDMVVFYYSPQLDLYGEKKEKELERKTEEAIPLKT